MLPHYLLRTGIQKFNKAGFPAVFYRHPKDLDSTLPRTPGNPWHTYWGLNRAPRRFESILRIFRFSSVRDVLLL